MHAIPLNSPLFFVPPPVGMKSPPVRVALLVFSDQNSEAHAGASITLFAKLMEANHFRLSIALRLTRSGRCCHRAPRIATAIPTVAKNDLEIMVPPVSDALAEPCRAKSALL
jgi:hypothetical protein